MVEITFGVTSKLATGEHVIIWDFDHVKLDEIRKILESKALTSHLPKIYILETSPGNYAAISLARCKFSSAFRVVFGTPNVDDNFLNVALDQGYFTLRIGPKNGYIPRLATVIDTSYEDESSIKDLINWVFYYTEEPYKGEDIPISVGNNSALVWAFQLQLEAILQDNWNRR